MSEFKIIPMARAKRDPFNHLWNNKDWIAETKIDGWRYLMHFGGECKRIYMVSRRDQESGLCVPQFTPNVNLGSLGYTVIDGEVEPPLNHEFHDIAGFMRTDPLTAFSARKTAGEIKYRVFDVLFVNGVDVRGQPLKDRIEILKDVLSKIFPSHPFVSEIERASTNTHAFLINTLLANGEGVVLKNKQSNYGSGWIKVKRASTLDVLITGFRPGYDCPIGAVIMGVNDGDDLREVGKCGISNWQVREAMNKDPDAFMGKVMEVKALRLNPSNGALREPRFIKLRPDMAPEDATMEKLQSDLLKVVLE